MKLATINDYESVIQAFTSNRKLFPHIRTDYVKKMIEKHQCVFDEGVIIMFNVYKRDNSIGTVIAPKNSCTLKQILNTNQGNGNAQKILDQFLNFMGRDVYLSVRADNERAIRFYLKNSFVKVGTIDWKEGSIPGHVYCWYTKRQELPIA